MRWSNFLRGLLSTNRGGFRYWLWRILECFVSMDGQILEVWRQGEFWEQLVFLWHTLSHKGLFLYARNVLWKIKKNIFQIPEHIFRLFEYENNVSSLKARVVLIWEQLWDPFYKVIYSKTSINTRIFMIFFFFMLCREDFICIESV